MCIRDRGMGAQTLSFESESPEDPAKFYINTCPAHRTYPTVKIDIDKANKRPLGAMETCNKRVINQYIHPAVMQSCQLCMGMTQLAPGSNWNSMPCHTHERRMEVYFYFELKDNNVVFHMMGEPTETRHLVTVSYTHLDVYKRQGISRLLITARRPNPTASQDAA